MTRMTGEGLLRGIGRWDLVALVVNGVIGAGIFGLPATLYGLTGSYSLLAFVICAIFIALLLLCFAEVASRFAQTGGPYLYARTAFGPVWGFQIGWLMWLTRLTGFAALCNLLVEYAGYFFPEIGNGIWRTITITALVTTLAVINFIGIRQTTLTSNVFTVGKLIPLLLLIGAGIFFIDPHRYSFAATPEFSSFSTAVLLLVFAFSGFEVALIPAGETHDPRRHMPFALLTAIGIVVVLYVLIQAVCIGTLPQLAQSQRPLADVGQVILGTTGASIITAGALVSIIGTLNTGMLATPRLLFAMSEHGQLPRGLTAVHERFHTPYIAILVSAIVMLIVSLAASFITALKISTLIRLITYGTICIALMKMRRSGDSHPASFTVPGGPFVAIAALALTAWLLVNSTWMEALMVGAAALLGTIVFVAYRFTRR